MSENVSNIDDIAIDNAKLKRMVERILIIEKENVKTKEHNDNEMKKEIIKIIEEEIGCY